MCPPTPTPLGLSTFLIPSTSVSQSPLPLTDLVTFLTGSSTGRTMTLSCLPPPVLFSSLITVLTQLNIFKPPPHAVYIEARNIAAIDLSSFRSDLQAGLDSCTTLSAEQLHRLLQNLLYQHAPATQRKVSSRPPSSWFCAIGPEILKAKRERRRAERQWLKSGWRCTSRFSIPLANLSARSCNKQNLHFSTPRSLHALHPSSCSASQTLS